ncbi:MAG: bifunctional 5,10-methylenetetrahydrofolate dehydrogenase/5,10-methenyltetrahydrofolate cyclohydrolase [Candidatus Magasanikbacteria bacterium]
MSKIIDGNALANTIHAETAELVKILKMQKTIPKLVVFLVGNNPASASYVEKKKKWAEYIGIQCEIQKFEETITTKKLIDTIKKVQQTKRPHGCIVQLPLPHHIDQQEVLNAIQPKRDVDCLTETNLGKLATNTTIFYPPTVSAILYILEQENVNLKEKHVVIVGAGILVGKPLTSILLHKEATVTICNKYTKNLKKQTKYADILVTAVGQKDLIRKDMIKRNAIVIDVGVSFKGKKMYGDAEFAKVMKKAKSITPTPGGVGPLTVAFLLRNTVIAASTKE